MGSNRDISTETVQRQLQRLRGSSLFSHSRRYPLFLDYVVRKTLEGGADDLKERTLGIEVFGRPADYDLNVDPVVRVTASEVRKRLAQYYYDPDHQQELRIELRPGSYVPEFRFVLPEIHPADVVPVLPGEPQKSTEAPDAGVVLAEQEIAHPAADTPAPLQPVVVTNTDRGTLWRRLFFIACAASIAMAAYIVSAHLRRPSSIDTFWHPVIETGGSVTICVGSVVAMVNTNAVAPPASTVSGHPLAVDPIAISDATVLSGIQQVLSAREKQSILVSSTGTSFSDLQRGPIVLISGFNNQWTMRLTDPLRFHLVRTSTDEYAIEDRQNTSQRWAINTATPFTKMTLDYALIARFHDPVTDQIAVVAAGIGENGTLAAGRVLTDEKLLASLKDRGALPRANQNFEAVIETQIIDGKPGPPRILITHLW